MAQQPGGKQLPAISPTRAGHASVQTTELRIVHDSIHNSFNQEGHPPDSRTYMRLDWRSRPRGYAPGQVAITSASHHEGAGFYLRVVTIR